MIKNSVIILDSPPDKKIKSIGSRCLIKLKKNTNILDYHIRVAKKILDNPQIIIACGFESKKIKKYVASKYENIICIEYPIDNFTNIGTGLYDAIQHIPLTNCLVWNTNHILHVGAINKMRSYLDLHPNASCILYSKTKGSVGLLIDNDIVSHCYYDLPNNLYDIMYLSSTDLNKFYCYNMNKLYLFEIINRSINDGIKINPILINSKYITIINTVNNIEKVKKQSCLI